jgi:hypothetical protein
MNEMPVSGKRKRNREKNILSMIIDSSESIFEDE